MTACVQQVATTADASTEADEKTLEAKRHEEEEQRLAALRAHGVAVTPETFAAWKLKFDAERLLQRAKLEPDLVNKDKGPTGKAFFAAQDRDGTVPLVRACFADVYSQVLVGRLSAVHVRLVLQEEDERWSVHNSGSGSSGADDTEEGACKDKCGLKAADGPSSAPRV